MEDRKPLKIRNKHKRISLSVISIIGLGVAIIWPLVKPSPKRERKAVIIADLSPAAEAGRAAFMKNCAACHGRDAAGTDTGPPLIHRIYHPGHHADFAFHRAVRLGVRQHHWRLGDMPALPHVSRERTASIIRFIREVQKANGVF